MVSEPMGIVSLRVDPGRNGYDAAVVSIDSEGAESVLMDVTFDQQAPQPARTVLELLIEGGNRAVEVAREMEGKR